jgi:hypothetical protein
MRILVKVLSDVFRWEIAHVDIPGEVSPKSCCRAGVYPAEVGEQPFAQLVNLAAGLQRLEVPATVKRLTAMKRLPDLAELAQRRAVERDADESFRRRVTPGTSSTTRPEGSSTATGSPLPAVVNRI